MEDIEIARNTKLANINEIAKKINVEDDIEPVSYTHLTSIIFYFNINIISITLLNDFWLARYKFINRHSKDVYKRQEYLTTIYQKLWFIKQWLVVEFLCNLEIESN